MNEKGPWALGLFALAVAALVSRGALPPGAAGLGSPAPKPAARDEGEPKKDAPWTELCPGPCLYQEFLGLPHSAATESWTDAAGTIAESAERQGYHLEFLVALVPDPVDSNFSNRFDEALDALQRGIAQSGYLFDRASLPWKGEAAKKRLYRSMPGGLLFRKVDMNGQRHLLAVFLVGESPKGGIQKQAFYTALDFMAGLQPGGAGGPLRLLGPSFSGSAESLQVALREWLSRGQPGPGGLAIDMVTGSATARGLESFFRKLEGDGIRVRFTRTIVDDDTLQVKAYELLQKRLGWNLDEVALITEFDTKYGESFQSAFLSPMVVEFPSNLAHIRTAREKLGLDRDQASAETPGTARKSLDLSLADHDEPIDVVPQLSELSTQVNDMALASLLRGISGKHYIGILATDIQDRLFLAEQVHSFCPDAVVFTFDNHLLDAHPKVSRSMDGTLVLTSHPLYRSPDGKALRQFTSEFQQGIYRAALQLVGGQRAEPSTVWLTAVGNGELWPIAVRSAELGPWELERPPDVPALPGAGTTGLKWLLAALAIAGLAIWLLRLAKPLQEARLYPWGERVPTHGAVLIPALGAGVLWLASAVLLVFYGLPLWDRIRLPCERGALWITNLAALFLIYLGMTFVLARLAGPRRTGLAVLLWTAAGALLPVLLGWAMLELWLFPEGARFFYARAGDFSSGLSPLVSLALLGLAACLWSILEIKRRRLIVAEDLPWPLRDSHEPALAACGRSAGKVKEVLLEPPRMELWGGLALVLLLPAARLFKRIQPIAETRGYGVFFVLLVMFVFVLAAISFYRFFVAWRRLERTLARLCNTWMLPVFSKSSKLLDWQPLKSFGFRMPPIKMTLVSAEHLRKLARPGLLGPDGAALAGEARGALDDRLAEVFEAEDRGEVLAEIAARRDLRQWFDRSARHLEWLRSTSPNTEETEEIETYLVIRVVAYLRYIFAHLRYALVAATICGLTLLVAVSSYAFQPKRFLSFAIWMALLTASVMTLRVFVQMDRNGALSAIAGTDAGKVSLDRTFFSNLFTYGGIPVLGIVLTQFPAVGHLFGGWLGPLLRVVGGGG